MEEENNSYEVEVEFLNGEVRKIKQQGFKIPEGMKVEFGSSSPFRFITSTPNDHKDESSSNP
jgi:hypothetical protein